MVASSTMPPVLSIPRVRNLFQKHLQLQCTSDRAIQLNLHARMTIFPKVFHNPMPHRLLERIPIRPARLRLIPSTSVEVILVSLAAPKREVAYF